MKTSVVRSILAVLVVGVFMGITAFMAIWPLVAKTAVDLNSYADFFAKTASVYTGIIGVIIGFYFARSETARSRFQERDGSGNQSGQTDSADHP